MKKILSLLIALNLLLLCACDDNAEISSADEPSSTIAETSSNISGSSDIQLTGGLNYSYSETAPLEYSGDEITMNIKLNISNSSATDMGVYLNVQGLFLPFTLQEYSDDSFTNAISDESEIKDFHQLTFTDEYCKQNKDRYFAVKFNPDMFPKGSVVYPDVVCSVNNTYLPKESGNVDISASTIFGVYPPALIINSEAKEQYKISDEYEITPMTKENADNSDNENVKAEILKAGEDSFQYFISTDKGNPINLRLRLHNFYDEYLKCDAQQAVVTVLVNDRPYAAFDGSKYLEISVDKNNFYTYDFTLDTDSLNSMNKVQLYVCQLKGTEENPYNTIAVSNPLYVQVNDYGNP